MKRLYSARFLSLLLCFCLILSCFAGLVSVSALHANPANVTRNWGTRGAVCTSLSQDALDYYSDNSAPFSYLKTLSGVYDPSDSMAAMSGNDLFDALFNLMDVTGTNLEFYSDHAGSALFPGWYAYTDCEQGDTSGQYNLIWGGGYRDWHNENDDAYVVNREHVWCQSHATYALHDGGCDLHHLRPASFRANSTVHNDRPYGPAQANGGIIYNDEMGNFVGWRLNDTAAYPEGLYEPPDNAKGDCARILLYVYTRWMQPNLYTSYHDWDNNCATAALTNFFLDHNITVDGGDDGIGSIDSLELLLDWCALDPVDTWEMGRNDSVQSIQGNRNVFIDYPELAWYLFGMTPPDNMTTPSGDAAAQTHDHRIVQVTVNNPAYGSAVITSDTSVACTPAPGYVVDDQLTSSTSGTVHVCGTGITVSGLTADASVSVVFKAQPHFTVDFSVPAGVTAPNAVSTYSGDTITLPLQPAGTPIADAQAYQFIGWATDPHTDITTVPAYYAPGAPYAVTADRTLHALYTYGISSGVAPAPFDPAGTGGDFVLAVNIGGDYYAVPSAGISAHPAGNPVTVTNGSVALSDAAGCSWTLENTANGFSISNGNAYLKWSSSTNLGSSQTAYEWSITAHDAATWEIVPSGAPARGLLYRANGADYFAAYVINNINVNSFGTEYYRLEIIPVDTGITTYYTTVLQGGVCSHSFGAWTHDVNNPGNHVRVCSLCAFRDSQPCAYGAWAHDAGNPGSHVRTCSVCSHTDSQSCAYGAWMYDAGDPGHHIRDCSVCSHRESDVCTYGTLTYDANNPDHHTGTCTVCSHADSQPCSYGIWVPDIDNPGSHIRTCAGCSHFESESCAGYDTIESTAGTDVTHLCTRCGYRYHTTLATYVVTYDVCGVTFRTESVIENSSASLAAPSAPYTGYTFFGWSLSTVNPETSTAPAILTVFTPTANVTLYAVYSRYVPSTQTTWYTTQMITPCPHNSSTLTGYVAAGCLTNGYTGDMVCDEPGCGAVLVQGTVIPAAHQYDDGVVTSPPSCTEMGIRAQTCAACGDLNLLLIPALGHDLPSCTHTSFMSHTGRCARCSETVTEHCTFKTLHTPDYVRKTCTKCGYTFYLHIHQDIIRVDSVYAERIAYVNRAVMFPARGPVNIKGTEYNFVGWVDSPVEETPQRPGNVLLPGDCVFEPESVTFYALYSRTLRPLYRPVLSTGDFASGDTFVIVSPDGGKTIRINDAGCGTAEFDSASGSVFSLQPNTKTGTWNLRSGDWYLESGRDGRLKVIPASETVAPAGWSIRNSASGTGIELYIKGSATAKTMYLSFTDKGFTLTENPEAAAVLYKNIGKTCYTTQIGFHPVHDYTESVTVKPTCTKEGEKAFVCKCGDCYYEAVPATGHRFEKYSINADGTHTAVCADCGDAVKEPHTYVNGVCVCGKRRTARIVSAFPVLDEGIRMVFTAEIPEGGKDPYMEFTWQGARYTVRDYTADSDGTCRFEFSKIVPQCMGEPVGATLHVSAEGEDLTDTVDAYSVRDYCVNMMNRCGDDDKTLKTLLSDLLVYGAAAQKYTGRSPDHPVTEGLSLTPSSFAPAAAVPVSFAGAKDETADWKDVTIALGSSVAMRFGFAADSLDGLTVKVSVNGREEIFDADRISYAGDGRYTVDFRGISATEFGDTVSASFFREDKQIGRTVFYSVNAYIGNTQNAANENLRVLVRTLYNYGASASAYRDAMK